MFTVNLDKDKYILSISHTKNDNVEIDLSLLDMRYLNAYKLVNSEIILDESKKAEMIAKEEQDKKDATRNKLIAQLESTNDAILELLEDLGSLTNPVTFITDMIALWKKYATLISERKDLRSRIKELGK